MADLRYAGQAYELTVPLDDGGPIEHDLMANRFHDEHYRTYSHKAENETVELVNLRVVAKVSRKEIEQPPLTTARPKSTSNTKRFAYFGEKDGSMNTPIIVRTDLSNTQTAGPLIIEEYDSTIVVPPGWTVRVDGENNILITCKLGSADEN